MVVYTIGHSTRSASEFAQILRAYRIELIADIRTIPRSRHNPQYDQHALNRLLANEGIEYVHLAALGGLRHPQKGSPNTGWRNASFRGYADYMQTQQFARAIDDLVARASRKTTALLCAEAVPWRCHRSLVGDALIVRHVDVEDILDEMHVRPHELTPWARVEGLKITYPKSEDP
jgi:uncharacterized protein (DUF488 family)